MEINPPTPREDAHCAQPRPSARWPRCVTFPNHFSKTYNRTFPRFFMPVRACTGLVSLCPFSRKTTQIAKRPNTCPPQDLQTKKIACVTVCHLRIYTTCARSARECLHPGSLGPSIPWPLFFRLLSPSILQDLRAPFADSEIHARQASGRYGLGEHPARFSSTARLLTRAARIGGERRAEPLPDVTKYRPKCEPPQPMPATSVGTISSSAVSPYVTLADYTAAGSLAGLPENSVFQMRSISSAPLSPYVRGRG